MDGNSDWGQSSQRQSGLNDNTANGIVEQCKEHYIVNDIDIREDKRIKVNLKTLNDSNVLKSLRFNIG